MTAAQEKYRQFSWGKTQAALITLGQKLKDGTYPLEEQPCFCGVSDDHELKTLDRDKVPHRVVVCKNCSLVRATPRMTREAYAAFYNNEYRDFTYRWLNPQPTNMQEEWDGIRQREYAVGGQIHLRLTNEDIPMPKVVVDFGCYRGGLLDYFKDQGAETWGIEYNQEARAICEAKGHKTVADVAELRAKGVKADLIIMQDVIEHLMDFKEMDGLGDCLNEFGYLYVNTPGLFRSDPEAYWQLAHTWYFTGATLAYLMDEMGWACTFIDEEITSFWQWRGPAAEGRMLPPAEWSEYIIDEAEGKEERRLPPFRGVCKYTKKLLYDNMRANYAKGLPDFFEITQSRRGEIAVVGGGPSIDGQIDELKALKTCGVPVITIARMYPWCVEHGIVPDYVVSLDCAEEQEKGFTAIQKETTHLIAAVSRPELIDMIKAAGAPIYLFDARDDRKIKTMRRDAGYTTCTVINSGGTVVITCMAAAFTIGFNDLHIFGFDCMFPSLDQFHAQGIAGTSVEQQVCTVSVNGEDVLTTPSFVEFARQALDIFSVAHEAGLLHSVKVYGDSLVSRMWDCQWHEEVLDGSQAGTAQDQIQV